MNGLEKLKAPCLSLLALLALSGCAPEARQAPPLEGAAIGGPFSLIDQGGRKVTDRDFAGEYRIVYFGYTYCPDVCPVDLQKTIQGYRLFEEKNGVMAAKVRPIFITVDPERDTPAVMKTYAAAFHPRLVGLTGSPEQIAAAAKAYGAYYKRQDQEGASEYLMDHSRNVILFGPDGQPIALLPQDQGAPAVAAELERWVQ
jgi:protein SCO1/2